MTTLFFGCTRPFGEIIAYLGRIEQQSWLSPHIHLLIWTKKSPPLGETNPQYIEEIARFIEQFQTAILAPPNLVQFSNIPKTYQNIPVPSLRKQSKHGDIQSPGKNLKFTGSDSHKWISKPFDEKLFDGSTEHNEILLGITVSTQQHNCQSYCLNATGICRFYFPFLLQARAGMAKNTTSFGEVRYIYLCPRDDAYLNSTQPKLTDMFRCNTDVTVIASSIITEAAYVCSYVVKADKQVMMDKKSIRNIRISKNMKKTAHFCEE